MAENKILVQIIDHENGNSVLGQDYFASREKAEEFKRISDRAYGKLLGEGQTRITTEIMERWYQPPFPIAATELCRSDTSSRALFCGIRSGSVLEERRLISDSTHPQQIFDLIILFTTFEHIYLCREMRRNYERTLIPVIRSVKHISPCGESTELKHGAHFWEGIGRTFLRHQ